MSVDCCTALPGLTMLSRTITELNYKRGFGFMSRSRISRRHPPTADLLNSTRTSLMAVTLVLPGLKIETKNSVRSGATLNT